MVHIATALDAERKPSQTSTPSTHATLFRMVLGYHLLKCDSVALRFE